MVQFTGSLPNLSLCAQRRREWNHGCLRNGRTVVYDVEGNMYGRPELAQLLKEHPIPQNAVRYDYSGSGDIDVLTRVCGWCGLLGLLFFRREKQISSS